MQVNHYRIKLVKCGVNLLGINQIIVEVRRLVWAHERVVIYIYQEIVWTEWEFTVGISMVK